MSDLPALHCWSPVTTPAPDTPKVFRLREVTARLRDILLPATQKEFWVRAQFVPDRGRRAGGHCYGHLVETDANGTDIAKLRVTIWKRDLERIETALQSRGEQSLQPLRTGGDICCLCAVRFHEVFGLSLSIFDVDPDFGESQLDRNRRVILEDLRQQGLPERNRQVHLGAVPLRIGLLTATHSAAAADFLQTLLQSAYGFQIRHLGSVMQGPGTSASLIAGLQQLQQEPLDLICLIRGGGSPLDLAWLDDAALAQAVANCALPVWVGIGHEIDVGVLDHVAHTSHKTPTAVAEALVQRIQLVDERLQSAIERLPEAVQRRLDLRQRELQIRENGLRQGTRKQSLLQGERLGRRISRLGAALAEQSAQYEGRFQTAETILRQRTRSLLEERLTQTEVIAARLEQGSLQKCRQSETDLLRGVAGLVEGSRKHQSWIHEKLTSRLQRLQATAGLATQQRQSALVPSRSRLRSRIRTALQQASEAQVGSRARLQTAFQARQRQAGAHLRWLAKSLGKVIPVLTRLEIGLQKWSARIRIENFESPRAQSLARLAEKQKRLEAMDPRRLLEKGYSLTRNAQGEIIRSAAEVQAGDVLSTQLQDGTVTSRVTGSGQRDNGDG